MVSTAIASSPCPVTMIVGGKGPQVPSVCKTSIPFIPGMSWIDDEHVIRRHSMPGQGLCSPRGEFYRHSQHGRAWIVPGTAGPTLSSIASMGEDWRPMEGTL